ncbi:hypothetical protein CPS_2098 [Colwellia psychrerythraea 34H]|uniref:Uncharacterized protein n=1 Tax=Colwellia psychrerythraea (strain 34H / ATCC BAA-681) TaxID=167879 RepID=Q483E2_COLP3|nr:hypothetical protein CPS_2098 [Colwellia psychrerythraea 34H]
MLNIGNKYVLALLLVKYFSVIDIGLYDQPLAEVFKVELIMDK